MSSSILFEKKYLIAELQIGGVSRTEEQKQSLINIIGPLLLFVSTFSLLDNPACHFRFSINFAKKGICDLRQFMNKMYKEREQINLKHFPSETFLFELSFLPHYTCKLFHECVYPSSMNGKCELLRNLMSMHQKAQPT